MAIDKRRLRKLNKANENRGPVVYWMSRDQRVDDNWALLFAQERAIAKKEKLFVVFCLSDKFLNALPRAYSFMLKSLKSVESRLFDLGIGFVLLFGDPKTEIPKILKKLKAGEVVSDFDPLKIKMDWKRSILKKIRIPFFEVDSHNIVPCFECSNKQEFAAYTIRPKIQKRLYEFLTDYPKVKKMKSSYKEIANDWDRAFSLLAGDNGRFLEFEPGEKAGTRKMRKFVEYKLKDYQNAKNDPAISSQSDLSPYLHFGQISAQRVALFVLKSRIKSSFKNVFLEELIVRRELADNFCFYNKNYDAVKGFPVWAQKTLDLHRKDRRAYLYNLAELEKANTHDVLWNAAQLEMVKRGKMNGYMRMYWAKKILEWTRSPEEAMKYAIYLNNKYELDGRDPNGYAGISWSIGGVHDRAWGERPIFGKIRYMSFESQKRKFDTKKYIDYVNGLNK